MGEQMQTMQLLHIKLHGLKYILFYQLFMLLCIQLSIPIITHWLDFVGSCLLYNGNDGNVKSILYKLRQCI